MAQSMLGLKSAWEKARQPRAAPSPTTDEVVKAFEGIEFEGPSGQDEDGDRQRPPGHRRTSPMAPIVSTRQKDKPEIVDIVRYPAECVNPPANMTPTEWLKAGMPGAKC